MSALLGSQILLPLSYAVPVATAQALDTLYQEKFTFCTSSLGTPAAEQAGWFAYLTGLRVAKIGNLKVFNGGAGDGDAAINSNPIGYSNGYAFWSRAVYGLTIATNEFPLPIAALEQVKYQQRLSGANLSGVANSTRLALLIGGTWYISARSVAQRNGGGGYEPVTFTLSNELFGTVADTPGLGPPIPVNYDTGVPLPANAVVSAFGVFLDEVNGRVRIDDFEIKGSAALAGVPTAQSVATAVGCPVESPDVTGVPAPSGPSSEEEAEDGPSGPGSGNGGKDPVPETQIPEGPKPPQLQNDFTFCPSGQVGNGATVKLGKQARRSLVKLPKNPKVNDERDAAIFAILAKRAMPIGSLVNVKISDFNVEAGTLSVVLQRNRAARDIRLSSKAKNMIDTYISNVRGSYPGTAPLFVSINARAASVLPAQAACRSELTRMIQTRARKAKVAGDVTFIKPVKTKKR